MTTKRAKARPETSQFQPEEMVQLSLLEPLAPDTRQPGPVADPPPGARPQSDPLVARQRRSPRAPGGVVECGWCGKSTPIPAHGRVPKWCSSSCRHRAWEQRRAAASGLCAIEVLDREIETVTVKTVIKAEPFTVPVERRPQSATEFAQFPVDLAHRLDTGRTYDRDLVALDGPVAGLIDSIMRRRRSQF